MVKKRKRTKRRLVFPLIMFVSFLFFVAAASSLIEFYYYNPDSVQSNFSDLKKGIDTFFQKFNLSTSFQAFSQKVDFDRMVANQQPALVLVPVWYLEEYGGTLGLQPLLTPSSGGKTHYYKVLLVRKNSNFSLDDLANKTVAMTFMGPQFEENFQAMFEAPANQDLAKVNIIITPKDVDALYALALGQVDAALVSQDTLEVIGDVNKRIVELVKKVTLSKPLPRPVLCINTGKLEPPEVSRLEKVFKESGKGSSLPLYMQMLRIDGWQEIN